MTAWLWVRCLTLNFESLVTEIYISTRAGKFIFSLMYHYWCTSHVLVSTPDVFTLSNTMPIPIIQYNSRNLTKYTGVASADLSSNTPATREVVIPGSWLKDVSRCKKTDLSCRIEGFAIDKSVAHSSETSIWFTYNGKYPVPIIFVSLNGFNM